MQARRNRRIRYESYTPSPSVASSRSDSTSCVLFSVKTETEQKPIVISSDEESVASLGQLAC
ncbi:hypothetical protein CCMA1212_010371 [Trichoderma ghanense]|uniref:Uncharacterized protein n=1 Tax=Trichoderma ghanense TaxID=65468 RepID=A0ABY2GPM9_9HYPO